MVAKMLVHDLSRVGKDRQCDVSSLAPCITCCAGVHERSLNASAFSADEVTGRLSNGLKEFRAERRGAAEPGSCMPSGSRLALVSWVAFAGVAALVQEFHREQKQSFSLCAFGLDFDKQGIPRVHMGHGELMRAFAHGCEKPLLCRQKVVLGDFPTRERISDVIPFHVSNRRYTAVLVNMSFYT